MSEEQVFISYSHTDADRDWVHAFAEALQRHGVKVWLDEFEVRVGASLSNLVEKGIRNSDMIVHIVTPDSIKQPNLFFEIGAAIGTGKRLVAILPQGFEPSLLPQPLRARRFLRQESPEKTAKQLVAKTMTKEYMQGKRRYPGAAGNTTAERLSFAMAPRCRYDRTGPVHLSSTDPLALSSRVEVLHGAISRLNPTYAHVVCDDDREYRVPYARLNTLESLPDASPASRQRMGTEIGTVAARARAWIAAYHL